MSRYRLIAIGASYGGVAVLSTLLPALSAITTTPIVVIQHRKASKNGNYLSLLNEQCRSAVVEAHERETICDNTVYMAPADYHLYIDEAHSFSLSKDCAENYSRPSIDVFFESAAEVYGDELIAVLLTGANKDGARGIASVHQSGGMTLVQDPATAKAPTMPQAAIDTQEVDYVLSLEDIIKKLNRVLNERKE